MSLMVVFQAILSHWRRHKGQALTLVLGLATATALWTGVQAINAEAHASYDRAAAVVSQNAAQVLLPKSGDQIPIAAFAALRRSGWHVTPVLEGQMRHGGQTLTVIGIDPLTAPRMPAAADRGDASGLTAFMSGPGQIFGAASTIARLKEAPLAGAPALIVSSDLPPRTVVADIAVAARLLQRPSGLSRIALLPDQPRNLPPLATVAPDLRLSAPSAASDLQGLTDSFHLNLTAFGLLAFAVGLFIVHGAIGLAFEQRRPVFRTLRALGTPLRWLVAVLLTEVLIIAVLAGALGVLLGYGMAAALLPGVSATLQGLYGAPGTDALTLRPVWVLSGFAIAVLGTGLAASQSLWRLTRLPILAAALPRAWAQASQVALRSQATATLGLLLVAAGLAVFGSGLFAGFLCLAALLTGAALALPPALSALLSFVGRRAGSAMSEWFWADSRQQLPGLSLALMALLLALAANIGVSTMVGSFRTTFSGWLDQRLAPELYVSVPDARSAEGLQDWLLPRVTAVLPRMSTQARLNGLSGKVQGLADHATYRDDWPLVSATQDSWDRLAAGQGVLINEQLSYRANLSPGDMLRLDDVTLPILAIYSDYGNPAPEAVLSAPQFQQLYPDAPVSGFALRLAAEDTDDISAGLRTTFNLGPDQIIDQKALKAVSLGIFEQTFAVTSALNVLTLAVAALAIFTSLLTLATLRLPQLAPVWALGVTRKTLAKIELARAAVLGALTALLALPVGLALAWVLLAFVNVEAFGWRLPMRLFPLDWLVMAGLAILTALSAAAIPARWQASRRPQDLLRVFAHER